MMKRLRLMAMLLLGAAAMTSCGLDEVMDMVQKPIRVQGEVDPNFGMPIAHGQVTLNDLMNMLDANYSGMITEDSTITFHYTANCSDSISAASVLHTSSTPAPHTVPTKGTLISRDTIITYSVDISLFDRADLQNLVSAGMNINHLWLDVTADVWGDCPEAARPVVGANVSALMDSLVVTYVDHDGVTHPFNGVNMPPFPIDNVLNHHVLALTGDNNIDLAPIINDLPKKVTVSFRFRFDLSDYLFNMSFTNISHFNELMDSIGMTKLYYDIDMDVRIPFDIQIGNLPYSFSIDLGEEGLSSVNLDGVLDSISEGLDVDLKDSYLTLLFDNGIPMDFRLSATFKDAYDVPIGTELFRDTILSAPTVQVGDTWEANGTTRSKVRMHMDNQRLQDLRNARKIEFNMGLATPPHHVRVKKTDYLNIRTYLQIHPMVSVNIPVSNGFGNNQ